MDGTITFGTSGKTFEVQDTQIRYLPKEPVVMPEFLPHEAITFDVEWQPQWEPCTVQFDGEVHTGYECRATDTSYEIRRSAVIRT